MEAVSRRAIELGVWPTPVRLDPETPARPIGVAASRGRCAPVARKHPRPGYFRQEKHLLNRPTLDRLHELRLDGMAKGFRDLAANPESHALERAEWLGLLVDQEISLRQQKRFEAHTNRQARQTAGSPMSTSASRVASPDAVPAPGQL